MLAGGGRAMTRSGERGGRLSVSAWLLQVSCSFMRLIWSEVACHLGRKLEGRCDKNAIIELSLRRRLCTPPFRQLSPTSPRAPSTS